MIKNNNIARVALALSLSCAFAGAAAAQAYEAPRNIHGQPDLEGVWTNASITSLERPATFKSLVLSEAEAKRLEQQNAARREAGDRPTDPNAPAPTVGGNVGGYNTAWTDPGTQVGRIKGEYRSSWIVEPADGKMPYSAEGRRIMTERLNQVRGDFRGPESRPLGERCLVGFGSTAGPPMLNVLYNNNYQIVQNKDEVAILVEMNHDVRHVRLNSKHLPKHITPWFGDSIGWWEGDTLVVETTNFNPQEALRTNTNLSFYISPDGKVTERFTRVAKDQILYEFEVDDPKIFTQKWKAQMPLNASNGPIYEYACHEGNHALEGILAGARQDEAAGRTTAAVDVGE